MRLITVFYTIALLAAADSTMADSATCIAPDDEAMVVPWKELWGEDDVPGSDPRYARAYAFPCTCAAIT